MKKILIEMCLPLGVTLIAIGTRFGNLFGWVISFIGGFFLIAYTYHSHEQHTKTQDEE